MLNPNHFMRRIISITICIISIIYISCYNDNYLKNRENSDESLPKDENIIIYRTDTKLSWSDFKGTIPSNIEYGGYLSVRIQMYNKVNPWSGKSNFDAYGFISKYDSWVTPSFKNEYNLLHFKLLFDISEIYAQRLENDLNSKNIRPLDKDIITDIFNSYDLKYREYCLKYERETNYGKNTIQQENWNDNIFKELFEIKHANIVK